MCVFAYDCVGSDVCVCAVCEEDMRAGSVDLQTCTFPQASLGDQVNRSPPKGDWGMMRN